MSSGGRVWSVSTDLPSYRAAVAELPVTTIRSAGAKGSVVVVPGGGDWWRGMLDARDEGAVAVVIAGPGTPRKALVQEAWPGDIPVIVERPRLRKDVVEDALRARGGSAARLVSVECAGPVAALDALACDGFGWLRSLAGVSPALKSGAATGGGRMALLHHPGRPAMAPGTLLATPVSGAHPGGLLQVLALGEVRTEVTVDQPTGLTRVETAAGEGSVRAPQRYESSPRLALRRAIAALTSGVPVMDLAELLDDMALALALRDGHFDPQP